jgi:hypothetical protein
MSYAARDDESGGKVRAENGLPSAASILSFTKNLSHGVSLHLRENIAPSKPGIKHLAIDTDMFIF